MTTLNGQRMPVDPPPVAVVTRRGTVVHGRVSHFSTCKAASRRLPAEIRLVQLKFSLN